MDPDEVPGTILLDHRFAKQGIRFGIRIEALGVELQERHQVVKYGPQGLIRVAFIKTAGDFRREFHGVVMLFFSPLLANRLAPLVIGIAFTGPADPLSTASSQ